MSIKWQNEGSFGVGNIAYLHYKINILTMDFTIVFQNIAIRENLVKGIFTCGLPLCIILICTNSDASYIKIKSLISKTST